MLKTKISTLMVAGAAALGSSVAFAGDRGTAEDATALLDKAAAHYNSVGRDQALKDFSTPGGSWQNGDLYVFCNDYDANVVAHGVNAKLIGKNLAKVKDADGKLFVVELIDTGKSGGGWVDYRWPNPVSKKIEQKSSIVKDFGGDVCGVGIYK